MKVLADPAIAAEFRAMVKDSVQGAQVLGLMTMGMRSMYSKKEVKNVDDIKGQKVRVQATKTEDTLFPAYGAQTVHMPFGDVYTSLQTGVVNVAENGDQRLPRQQALRGRAGPVDHRARGEQQLHLGQRQDLEQPDAAAAGVGAGGRRRGVQARARDGAQAREGLRGQAEDDGRQGGRKRRQDRASSRTRRRSRTSWRRNSGRMRSSS